MKASLTLLVAPVAIMAGLSAPDSSSGAKLPKWATAGSIQEGVGSFPDAPVVELYRCEEIEVHSSGKRIETTRGVAQVRRGDGAGYGVRAVEEIYGLKVKQFRAWHKPLHAGVVEIKDLLETQLGEELFSDARKLVLAVPGIGRGSLVAYELVVEDETRVAMTRFPMHEGLPVVKWELRLKLPGQWSAEAFNLDGDELTQVEPASVDDDTWRWAGRDLDVPSEVPSDPPVIWLRWVTDSENRTSMITWEDIARWYTTFDRDVLADPGDLTGVVQSLPFESTAGPDRAAAAARFVQSAVHYVQIYREDGGWRPHRPVDVAANRYGDCKDMAYLLIALLDAVGLVGRPALTNFARVEPVRPDFPTALFNHCIVEVRMPRRDGPSGQNPIFFDPTAKWVPWGRLPHALEDRWALVTGPGPRLVRLPSSRAEENVRRYRLAVRLLDDGSAEAKVGCTLAGHPAFGLRRDLNQWSEGTMRDARQRRAQDLFPGAVLRDFRVGPLSATDVDTIGYGYTVELPQIGQSAGGSFFAPLDPTLERPSAETMRLREDGAFDYAWSEDRLVTLRWPAGWKLDHAPRDTFWEAGGMSFERRVEPQESGISCSMHSRVEAREFPPEFHDRIEEWTRVVLGSRKEKLVLSLP